MPVGGSQTESGKKRSSKKRRSKSKSKPQTANKNPTKNRLTNQYDFNKLTPANLSSLRWDNKLTDPALENDRIENYKELRRQRYDEARQQALQTLVEKMKITDTNISQK